jgi:YVTN family beta-propeller protein
MLRVSPDGKQLWVQAATANTNSILDPDTLEIKSTQPAGKGPVTNAWSPDGRYVLLTHANDTFVTVHDGPTAKEIKRIEIGQNNSNVGFTPDSKTAYVAVTGTNSVAVIDLGSLTVVKQIQAGKQPQGLIVMAPPA